MKRLKWTFDSRAFGLLQLVCVCVLWAICIGIPFDLPRCIHKRTLLYNLGDLLGSIRFALYYHASDVGRLLACSGSMGAQWTPVVVCRGHDCAIQVTTSSSSIQFDSIQFNPLTSLALLCSALSLVQYTRCVIHWGKQFNSIAQICL